MFSRYAYTFLRKKVCLSFVPYVVPSNCPSVCPLVLSQCRTGNKRIERLMSKCCEKVNLFLVSMDWSHDYVMWDNKREKIDWSKKDSSSIHIQLNPAITDVKGLMNFICYRRIFVIANIRIKKKWNEGTKILNTL